MPSFQSPIQSIVGTQRGAPDVASDSDPYSGVAMYDSFPYGGNIEGWMQIGGTSLATPLTAGRVAASGIFSSTATLQNEIYGEYGAGTAYNLDFRDITTGNTNCFSGWNVCAGIGSSIAPSLTAVTPGGGTLSDSPNTTIIRQGSCSISTTRFAWTYTDGSGPHQFPGSSVTTVRVGTGSCKGTTYSGLGEWSTDGLYYLEAWGPNGTVTAYQ